jgi:malate dehydrogenase (oxaloacetate-decarboxylating)
MLKLAVLISGRGSNLTAIQNNIESGILQGKAKIAVVVSNKADAKGLVFAKERGLTTAVCPTEKEILAELKKYSLDLICLAGYMRIISPEFLKTYKNKIINIHPALLPNFPGLHVHEQVLAAKVKESGCTVHYVDEGVDTGPVLAQARVPVHPEDTVETLSSRVLAEEHKLYSRVIESFYEIFKIHEGGKLNYASKHPLTDYAMLSKVYTPGVARVCKAIESDPSLAKKYTMINNTVAVITDGTAVLGLGDIGPVAGMPVMEGKSVLFKEFGGVDSVPILLGTKDVEEIIKTIINIAPSFGGINLEDISAPRCFEIEERLKEVLNIPVFHDDQHGTAVVSLAGIINSLKLVGKKISEVKIAINGAGAAGISIARLLMAAGAQHILLCDSVGAIYEGREQLNPEKTIIAMETNKDRLKGKINDVLKGFDIFIGVSVRDCVKPEAVQAMNKDAIVFAMANPDPEISPNSIKGIARIIATGRSDYPNQINNVLCFPGLFRGALDAGAQKITQEMCLAAARAIAGIIPENELRDDYIIPSVFDRTVAPAVAKAVAAAWNNDNLAKA